MRRLWSLVAMSSLSCGGVLEESVGDAAEEDSAILVDATVDVTEPDVSDAAIAEAQPDVDASDADALVACNAIVPTGSSATAFQIDFTHQGAQPGDALSMPLCERWRMTFGSNMYVAYPVVSNGKVFVTMADFNSTGNAYALDAKTGAIVWGPVQFTSTGGAVAGPAFDADRLFVSWGNKLFAFEAADGGIAWTTTLNPQFFSHDAIAANGTVYTIADESGGTLFAVEEGDGAVDWTRQLGLGGGVALTGDRLVASVGCQDAYGVALDGGLAWFHQGPCSGGFGLTPAVVAVDGGARVFDYSLTPGLVLDVESGDFVGYFQSDRIPAFADGVMYAVRSGVLTAVDVATNAVEWTFGSSVALPPLVVGQHVVVASTTGEVSLVDRKTGKLVSSALTQLTIQSYNDVVGMAAADGMLFVSTGNTVVAF